MKFLHFACAAVAFGAASLGAYSCFSGELPSSPAMTQRLRGQHTVADRLAEFGPGARARWQPYFEAAKVAYPPQEIILLGLKQEKKLEVYARAKAKAKAGAKAGAKAKAGAEGEWHFVRALPIVKGSGVTGPKLREGDRQVPEGFYPLTSLNPNSAYHLSLRVGYPNLDDKIIGLEAGRTERELGGDIMIHGGAASIGCLAMGDQAAEDLFVLAAEAKRDKVQIVLSPLDFRVAKLDEDSARPAWVKERYAKLEKFVKSLPSR